MSPSVSIVIRTLNEGKWLRQLLEAVGSQALSQGGHETIIVDSGSTDGTLDIAREYQCRVISIRKEEFTFGRSLNRGCAAAEGRNLAFISGHCIPTNGTWLRDLVAPLESGDAQYAYGRQLGYQTTRFSEKQIFEKYFPASRQFAQGGFFCNNANAALRRDVWVNHPFDEELTGLEDMQLGKRLLAAGMKLAYVPEAGVFHIHEENWAKIRLRYEREAIALQQIMPEVHLNMSDFLRYFISAVLHDSGAALQEKVLLRFFPEIVAFRLNQYWGSYRGNNDHRRLSLQNKERYFYPR